uniref:Uncharacterized protein n=1 Tax=Rhizophora mucronata TaxID=61149 RepID=A0A2P2PMJ3_RHIMU
MEHKKRSIDFKSLTLSMLLASSNSRKIN